MPDTVNTVSQIKTIHFSKWHLFFSVYVIDRIPKDIQFNPVDLNV